MERRLSSIDQLIKLLNKWESCEMTLDKNRKDVIELLETASWDAEWYVGVVNVAHPNSKCPLADL